MPNNPDFKKGDEAFESVHSALVTNSDYYEKLPAKLRSRYLLMLSDVSALQVKALRLHKAFESDRCTRFS